MRRTPEVPTSAAFQNASRPTPIGVTTSMPVTTTRRVMVIPLRQQRVAAVGDDDLPLDRLGRRARQEVDDVGDRFRGHERAGGRAAARSLEQAHTVFTVMPRGASSTARYRVIASAAAFETPTAA